MNVVDQKRISHTEQFLLIEYPEEKIVHYADYDKRLERLLTSDIVKSCLHNRGYLRLELVDKQNRIQRVLFHHFVYCFYHYDMTEDNVFDILSHFRKYLRDSGKCVGHLDGHKWNHCKENLSVVTIKENAQHRELFQWRDFSCFKLDVAYTGQNYIVQITYQQWDNHIPSIVECKFICESFRDLLAMEYHAIYDERHKSYGMYYLRKDNTPSAWHDLCSDLTPVERQKALAKMVDHVDQSKKETSILFKKEDTRAS